MVELCKKCNTEVTHNFCPNCGHPRNLKRIDRDYVISELISVFNLQKGILFTIRELLFRPGKSVHIFISEDRSRLVKPVMFLLIMSLVYTFLAQLLHFEDMYVSYADTKHSTTLTIVTWVQGNYGYANILMAVFIALWLRLFFRRYCINVFEILVLLSFVMGMGDVDFCFVWPYAELIPYLSYANWSNSKHYLYDLCYWAVFRQKKVHELR